MEFVRKTALVIIAPLLVILLFGLAVSTGLLRVVTNPVVVKNILDTSGIYGTVVPGLLDEAKQISSSGGEVPLVDELVRAAALKTFSPDFVKQNTEAVLDSVYYWLDGNTPLPDFQIDLSAIKTKFAANVGDAVEARLAALPACTSSSAGALSTKDPLKAACLPAGMDPAAEAATVEQNILSGTGFIDRPVITADTLKGSGDTQSVFTNQFKDVPEAYQKIKATPIILGILTLLLMAAIVLLSSTKRKGLRRVGVMLLVVGLLMLGFSYGLNKGAKEGLKQISLANAVLEDKSKVLITQIVQEIDKTYWIFGAVYTVLGVTAISGAVIINRKKGGKPADKVDLEGEGKTPEDRIDLKEPEKATPLAKSTDNVVQPKPKPPTKKPPQKIKVQ